MTLKDCSLNLKEDVYHALPAWSYSMISKYAKEGFAALATIHDKTTATSSMEFGSLFDCMVTRGKDTLNEYVVSDISVPDVEKKAMEYIASTTNMEFDKLSVQTIDSLCNECGYYPKWGIDARMKHLVPFKQYYNNFLSGKKVVSEKDWKDAMDMYYALKNSENTKPLFQTKSTDEIEYLYQLQFMVPWMIDGKEVSVKMMADLIIIDHKNKTILPVDLKTSAMPAYDWKENFIKLRYDLQAELYSDVIRKVIEDRCEKEYEGYTILPYIFADISRADKVPVTYHYDPSNGFTFTKGDKTFNYKGWKELLSEILVYEELNAKVPNYISLTETNDIIELLSRS